MGSPFRSSPLDRGSLAAGESDSFLFCEGLYQPGDDKSTNSVDIAALVVSETRVSSLEKTVKMIGVLQRTAACLLAVMLGLAGLSAGSSPFVALGNQSAQARRCCGSGCGTCSALPCCARPAERHTPVSPASVPQSCSRQIHALLAEFVASAAFLPIKPDEPPCYCSPLPRAGAVPIFQRDCSFLI